MLRTPEVLSEGAQLFFTHCSQCHGEKADGKGTIHRQLSSKPVDFTDKDWRAEVSPRWVYYIIREGRKHTAMAGSARRLDDESCWKLAAFVLSVAEQ
jgi:mono/diheme cytochrome c family protein